MKRITTILALFTCATSVVADTFLPSDTRVVSDQTTQTSLGPVDTGTTAPYAVRSRADTSQNDRQVATFLQFDVSSLTVEDVNNPAFEATFRIDYSTRLNTINALTVMVGRNTSGT